VSVRTGENVSTDRRAAGHRVVVAEAMAATLRQQTRRRRTMLAVKIGLLIVLLGVWEAAGPLFGTDRWVSSPSEVVATIIDWSRSGSLWAGLAATLSAAAIGFVGGALLGALLGFLLGWSPTLGEICAPYLLALYTVPKIALAPLFVLWFGIGLTSKVMMAGLLVFFLVFFTTFQGVRDVDPELVDVTRVLGASQFRTMLLVGLPSAMTWVFSGLKMALPYSLIGAVVGELIASTEGIGYMIGNATASLDTSGVFAGLVVLMVVAFSLSESLRLLEKRVLRWRPVSRREVTP
jgi:NitT/TauT family transport system permease protein